MRTHGISAQIREPNSPRANCHRSNNTSLMIDIAASLLMTARKWSARDRLYLVPEPPCSTLARFCATRKLYAFPSGSVLEPRSIFVIVWVLSCSEDTTVNPTPVDVDRSAGLSDPIYLILQLIIVQGHREATYHGSCVCLRRCSPPGLRRLLHWICTST